MASNPLSLKTLLDSIKVVPSDWLQGPTSLTDSSEKSETGPSKESKDKESGLGGPGKIQEKQEGLEVESANGKEEGKQNKTGKLSKEEISSKISRRKSINSDTVKVDSDLASIQAPEQSQGKPSLYAPDEMPVGESMSRRASRRSDYAGDYSSSTNAGGHSLRYADSGHSYDRPSYSSIDSTSSTSRSRSSYARNEDQDGSGRRRFAFGKLGRSHTLHNTDILGEESSSYPVIRSRHDREQSPSSLRIRQRKRYSSDDVLQSNHGALSDDAAIVPYSDLGARRYGERNRKRDSGTTASHDQLQYGGATRTSYHRGQDDDSITPSTHPEIHQEETHRRNRSIDVVDSPKETKRHSFVARHGSDGLSRPDVASVRYSGTAHESSPLSADGGSFRVSKGDENTYQGSVSSVRQMPEPSTQKALLERYLSPETKPLIQGDFWYEVSGDWMKQWSRYVGLGKSRTFDFQSRTTPGPITTPRDHAHHNIGDVIHEDGWNLLVVWYGLSPDHTPFSHIVYSYTDRKPELEKSLNLFKLAIARSEDGESHMLRFSKMEKIGHVEWKIRESFVVDSSFKSRLWAKSFDHASSWKPLFNRASRICEELKLDSDFIKSELELEILSTNGSWQDRPPRAPPTQDFPVGCLLEKSIFETVSVANLEDSVHREIDFIAKEFLEKLHACVTNYSSLMHAQFNQRNDQQATAEASIVVDHKDFRNKREEILEEEASQKAAMETLQNEQMNITAERKKLQRENQEWETRRTQLDDEIKQMEELNKMNETRVKLDIGGHVYTTSLTTLTKDHTSRLATMFSGRHALQKDGDGCFFLDRDGTHFRIILNYLRDNEVPEGTLPETRSELREILREAEYYKIKGLAEYIRGVSKAKN